MKAVKKFLALFILTRILQTALLRLFKIYPTHQ